MFAKWLDAAKIYADRRMPVMLAFGFSSGFPLLLVGSTLTVWLQESQIPYALIGLFFADADALRLQMDMVAADRPHPAAVV